MADEPPLVQTWHQAQLNATRWLRGHGFPDAAPVPGGADTGADIRSPHVVARVVHGPEAVKRDDVRTLAEARGDAEGMHCAFFASSRFELPATTYADTRTVMLFTYDEDGAVTPRNLTAKEFLPPEERPAPRGRMSGPWAPVLRHAPLGIAIYLAVFATISLVRSAGGASVNVGNVAFSLIAALLLAAYWFFVSRKLRPMQGKPPGRRP